MPQHAQQALKLARLQLAKRCYVGRKQDGRQELLTQTVHSVSSVVAAQHQFIFIHNSHGDFRFIEELTLERIRSEVLSIY
jgi:hypothetical protein